MIVVRGLLCVVCFTLLGACASPTSRLSYEARPGLIIVGGFVVYYDSEGPLSYQAMTRRELPKDISLIGEVMGNSCQHGLSIPIFFSATDNTSLSGAKGDGSFKKALLNIRAKHPDLSGLFDVKVDVEQWSVLTVYQRECTIVAAQGFKRKNSNMVSPLPNSARN